MKKIGIFTGTRAEYGLLKPLINRFFESAEFEMQLVVTGMHLSPEFGLTYQEIEKDGYPIVKRIEMLLSSDSAVGITKSMGLAMISFAEYFEEFKPDIVIILGDRYEMLAAASAAMIANVPIAHIHGGERTEGMIDEAIRHSITKMSYLHFPAAEEYRKRIIQLGENPERVFCVGSLGVESIKKLTLLTKHELESQIGFTFSQPTLMVTFHPVTLEKKSAAEQFKELLEVLKKQNNKNIVFTKANADTDGRIINQMIDEFVQTHSHNSVAFFSMGQLWYLSALQYCYGVVGNSSSGILEAPSFRIPTINIGDRQKGRVRAKSIIDCEPNVDSITRAFIKLDNVSFREQVKEVNNPYEGKSPSKDIYDIIQDTLKHGIEIKKMFFDLRGIK